MAKAGVSEGARIRKLHEALDRAKRECLPGTVLSSQPMCQLLRVSWPTLRDWCRIPEVEASGAFLTGDNGVEWQFAPVATIWVLIRHFEQVRDVKLDRNRRAVGIATGDALQNVPEEFDLRDTRELVRLLTEVRNRQEADGKLIDADTMRSALRETITAIQGATLTAATVLDPTGEWDPELREAFDDAMSRALVLQADAAAKCLASLDVARPVAREPVGAR